MTASESTWSVFSKFTLTFMQATGWYIAKLGVAEPLGWGENGGCGYLDVNEQEL